MTADGTTKTLREALDEHRAEGERFNMRTIVAMMVPFITRLAERHADGETFFLHPSCIGYSPPRATLLTELAQEESSEMHDHACLAPELRAKPAPGDSRASVFAIGGILYELATGESVGPAMRRPSDLVKGIPESFETLIGKALVGDPAARPTDLAALAQALHHCAPMASIPPPSADESHLDHDEDFDVDVSLSLMPPAPATMQVRIENMPSPAAIGQSAAQSPGPASSPDSAPSSGFGAPPSARASSTGMLTDLKTRLESDPRSRYVVIKEGMDHGPFTAVELLQQVAQSVFREEHFLRDTLSQEERQVSDWEEFAPFAEHARLNRRAEGEKKNLEAKVVEEQVQTQNKALIGLGLMALFAAAFGGWWFRQRAVDDVRVGVSADEAQLVDFDKGLVGKKGPGYKGGGKWAPGAAPDPNATRPVVAGGGSCESARNAYIEDYTKLNDTPPDLTAGSYGAVLNRGTYLNSCGVPPNMGVSICAAVQNGRAVGVTVRTDPNNGGVSSCIRSAVFGMSFPAHPRLDITSTMFRPE
jgi:eukaryotic-like serine/threonine-protein kinase